MGRDSPTQKRVDRMAARSIVTTGRASSCYFRTTTDGTSRKALVQIDERCNLHCAHCFVSATKAGASMSFESIVEVLIPRLAGSRVERVTLTGGEPTIHPQFIAVVRAFRAAGMEVGFCTNATTLTSEEIEQLAGVGGVHANVSLDGFRAESHGKFRGDRGSFHTTIDTVRRLGAAGLLQGLLCTPNSLAEDAEYRELCEFAVEQGARYVLMNPLSSMGRGVRAHAKMASATEHMHQLSARSTAPTWTWCTSGSRTPTASRWPAARRAPSSTCSPPAR
jgi:MoaA/NifB/PqqE/SkfB family radical SAM enzyme